MHFDDLSLYRYSINRAVSGVLMVGWLGKGVAFPTGPNPAGFADKLNVLITVNRVRQTRGFYVCHLCPASSAHSAEAALRGSAEVWVPGRGCVYAAPTLVGHYVSAHGYAPPSDFVTAVMDFDLESGWDAKAVANAAIYGDSRFGRR